MDYRTWSDFGMKYELTESMNRGRYEMMAPYCSLARCRGQSRQMPKFALPFALQPLAVFLSSPQIELMLKGKGTINSKSGIRVIRRFRAEQWHGKVDFSSFAGSKQEIGFSAEPVDQYRCANFVRADVKCVPLLGGAINRHSATGHTASASADTQSQVQRAHHVSVMHRYWPAMKL